MTDQRDDEKKSTTNDSEEGLPSGTRSVLAYAERNPEAFKQINDLVAKRRLDDLTRKSSEAYASKLRSLFASMDDAIEFRPGDLVEWKVGLKNRRRPDYGEPGIVIQLVSPAVLNAEDEYGSVYFREPLDIIVGLLDDDEELIAYHFDSRRFRRHQH